MFIIDIITSPSQLQTTTHDMTLSVLQHQVTTITASRLISTEYQNDRIENLLLMKAYFIVLGVCVFNNFVSDVDV